MKKLSLLIVFLLSSCTLVDDNAVRDHKIGVDEFFSKSENTGGITQERVDPVHSETGSMRTTQTGVISSTGAPQSVLLKTQENILHTGAIRSRPLMQMKAPVVSGGESTSTKTLDISQSGALEYLEHESITLDTGSLISVGESDESNTLLEKATEAEVKELIDILIESGR